MTKRTYADGMARAAALCMAHANTLPTYGRLAYVQAHNMILRDAGLSGAVPEVKVERDDSRGLSGSALLGSPEPPARTARR